MEKSKKIVVFIIIFSFIFIINCYATDTIEINQLIENASSLDNTVLTIQGELIGEALERNEYAWINVNDGTNATGVFIKQSDIDKIKYYGDYKHRGDIVKITGTFYKSCKAHGGDVDIHCSSLEIIEKGHINKEEVSRFKIIFAVILFIIASLILIVYLKQIKSIS